MSGLSFDSLLDELIAEGLSSIEGDTQTDIITFAESFIFNDESKLFPTQRSILKSFYCLPLTEDEKLILNEWKEEDRTTYLEDRKYMNLVFEGGRWSCHTNDSYIPTTVGTITFKELLDRHTSGEKIGIYTYSQKDLSKYITYDISLGDNGVHPVIELTTKSGRSETCTYNHPYFIWRDEWEKPRWVELEKVRVGDKIAVSKGLEVFGNESIGIDKVFELSLIEDNVDRRIPDCIKRLKRRELAVYIESLFSLSIERYTLHSISFPFLQELQIELLKFNIESIILRKEDGAHYLLIEEKESQERINGLLKYNLKKEKDNKEETVRWDTISSLTPLASQPTVAIEVKGTNVIGNSIISHNTKSTLASIIVLYEFYKLIILKSPSEHYGLLPNSPIAIFVISQSQEQVKQTLFGQVTGYANNSHFFKGLAKSGKIEILTEEIRCKEKNIAVYAKHTNSKSLVGFNLKLLVLDEAARFEKDEFGQSKGAELWGNVGRATRRFGAEGRKVVISSAWEEGDYIQFLYNVSERDPNTIGFRMRTWDVNLHPDASEQFLKATEDYINNPMAAALEYEGVRSVKQGSFMIPANIKAAIRGTSILDANQYPIDIDSGDGDIRYYVGVQVTRLETNHDIPTFIHIDYGIRKDSAALAACHAEMIEDKWVIIVDCILVWKPYVDKDRYNNGIKRIVSFLNVEDILMNICTNRKVIKCSFDQFNSEYMIQKLHLEGVSTELMSTSVSSQLNYFTITKNLIDQDLLILPRDSTWSSAAEFELINLIQNPVTGKIDHNGTRSSKDIADAIVNAVFNCYSHSISSGAMFSINTDVSSIQSSGINSRIKRSPNRVVLNKKGISNLNQYKKSLHITHR